MPASLVEHHAVWIVVLLWKNDFDQALAIVVYESALLNIAASPHSAPRLPSPLEADSIVKACHQLAVVMVKELLCLDRVWIKSISLEEALCLKPRAHLRRLYLRHMEVFDMLIKLLVDIS